MMATAYPLRPFLPADTMALRELFAQSIEELTADDYDEDQRVAWAAAAADAEAFAARLGGMVTLVVRVADPYGRGEVQDRPPLRVGMFVEAEIEGRTVRDAVSLPRSALRDRDSVFVVDDHERLRVRSVEVLQSDRERVVLSGGVRDGERVVVSPLEVVVDGMVVRVLDEDPARER